MPRSDKQSLGRLGEELARLYYRAEGYTVLASRYRTRYGELDLVVARQGVMAFVEVKTRRGGGCGTPAEAVGARKLARMRRIARQFLAAHGTPPARTYRFDVVAVSLRPDGSGFDLDLLAGVS